MRACVWFLLTREPGSQVADAFYLFCRESLTLSAAISQACKTISARVRIPPGPSWTAVGAAAGRVGRWAAVPEGVAACVSIKRDAQPETALHHRRRRRCIIIVFIRRPNAQSPRYYLAERRQSSSPPPTSNHRYHWPYVRACVREYTLPPSNRTLIAGVSGYVIHCTYESTRLYAVSRLYPRPHEYVHIRPICPYCSGVFSTLFQEKCHNNNNT